MDFFILCSAKKSREAARKAGRETRLDGVLVSMKQTGSIKRFVALALVLALTLPLFSFPAFAEGVKQYGYIVINNSTKNRVVNFRRQPNSNDNTNYPFAHLPEFWVVEVLERTNANKTDWYKVNANINTTGVGEANYQTGYVMASFLHVMTAEEQAQWLQNPTAKYQPGGAAQPTAVPAVPTAIPALVTATPAQSAGAILGYVKTVKSGVNLRETPDGKVVNENEQVPINQVLAYYGLLAYQEYDWVLVQYRGKAGYMRSDCYMACDANGNLIDPFATPAPTAAPAVVPTAAPVVNPTPGVPTGLTYGRVTADNVFFRKNMSTTGDFWARLPLGWTLEVLEIMDPKAHGGITWYKVKGSIPSNPSRTYTGYIHGNFFTLIESTVTAAPTAIPTLSNYALVILDGINLRQTPGGVTLMPLMSGAVVNVLSVPAGSTANDWYYVEINGTAGYLPATSLRRLTTAELSQYVLPPAPAQTAAPTAAPSGQGGYIKLIKDKVNIRKTPAGTVLTPKDTDKMRVGTVLSYTGAAVNGGGYNWVLINYQGITGYVRGDCFTYCDAAGNPLVAPTAAPTAAPTFVPGVPTPDPTDTPSSVNQGYIKLIKGGVNLRQSIWGKTLGQLDRGTILPYFNIVTNKNSGAETWYEVYSSKIGTFGFILGTMAELCDAQGNTNVPGILPTASPASIVGYVATTASSVWLRITPNATADTAGQVKAKGTVLPMIGPAVTTDYTWYPVQTAQGVRAYLRGDFVFMLADWQLDLYNTTGKLATPTPGPATPRPGNSSYIQVVGGKLWMRETPSRKANTVGILADAAVVKFNRTQTVAGVTWYQVTFGGATGWVMGTYTKVLSNAEYDAMWRTAAPATPAPGTTATPVAPIDPSQFSDVAVTTADRVRIRAGASMTSKEIGMVYVAGTVMTYLGHYTQATATNPYVWYNIKYQGVSGWMRGDFMRVLSTAEKQGQQGGEQQSATYRTLYKNSSGEDVLKLQQRLIALGYLAADQATGVYLTSTENAVIAFQRASGLTVDGIAGSKTQHALFGTVEPGTDINNPGSSVSVTLYPVEKIDWFTGGIQSIWSVGTVAIITDVYTGISFRAQRLYGDNHADCEPLTTADTAAVCAIYGVSNPQEISDREQELQSYRRRPLWVTIGGRTFAASMYGIPHNFKGDRIADNGYNGQFCVHFTNSKTHGSGSLPAQVDPDASYNNYFGHQSAINYAYVHSVSGNK